ncbi:hypothetical protein HRbin22_01005 [Candidatus Thermoflexus japonica]|uniref:Uncharacterized protein n=1 Tax=Candidatus Thermoflexus japonica TaxID=2035417 RepID=A0A2H5Y5N7_9CHLR|nr:hypothetical protein HRbin22_01005 [Candidatus Thermoflexus japonica]
MSAIQEMVKALAALPEEQRRTMMAARLELFAEMSEAERRRSMAEMIDAMMGLPEEERRRLLRTRLEILAGFPEDKRMRLLQTHMAILQEKGPTAVQQEMSLIHTLINELSPTARAFVQKLMAQMGPSHP